VSAHAPYTPTRDELVRAISNKPVNPALKLGALALAVLGFAVFAYGALTGNDRAWLSLQFNWLYFTVISSAGVAFAAVQRLTTARWSRAVVRIPEGLVAWLPVAFVLQLIFLFFSGNHLYSWSKETVHTHQKAVYLDPTFFRLRGVLIFGAMTAFMLWFVYRSVRLDVGVMPEQGAGWARGPPRRHAPRLRRRAARAAQRALAPRQAGSGGLPAVRLGLAGAGVGLLDDLLAPLPVDDVRLAGVHGRAGSSCSCCSASRCASGATTSGVDRSSARATSTTWASSASRSPRSGATSRSASTS
jgi:hypothetical protein